jgi:hypothetical protein
MEGRGTSFMPTAYGASFKLTITRYAEEISNCVASWYKFYQESIHRPKMRNNVTHVPKNF